LSLFVIKLIFVERNSVCCALGGIGWESEDVELAAKKKNLWMLKINGERVSLIKDGIEI
jgi:hypothetical protein